MSTKTYQNVSIAQLLDWSKHNPNRGHILAPIRVQPVLVEEKGTPLTPVHLPDYQSIPVPNLLGIIAYIRDPLFADASTSVKNSIIRELATALQTETETLSGSKFARKRRRIHDGIGAVFNGKPIKDEEWMDICNGCAHLAGVNFIYVRHAASLEEHVGEERPEELLGASKGAISFSSDPATWTSESPVWFVDWHARWIGVGEGVRLSRWLGEVERGGWIIDWPVVDSTKELIVQELMLDPTWMTSHAKLKKDVLAARLGRMRAIIGLAARE